MMSCGCGWRERPGSASSRSARIATAAGCQLVAMDAGHMGFPADLDLGIEAFTVPDYTGVWVGNEAAAGDPVARANGEVRKIASIGVHVSRWVTWHPG